VKELPSDLSSTNVHGERIPSEGLAFDHRGRARPAPYYSMSVTLCPLSNASVKSNLELLSFTYKMDTIQNKRRTQLFDIHTRKKTCPASNISTNEYVSGYIMYHERRDVRANAHYYTRRCFWTCPGKLCTLSDHMCVAIPRYHPDFGRQCHRLHVYAYAYLARNASSPVQWLPKHSN
jgi:hypothetical protein